MYSVVPRSSAWPARRAWLSRSLMHEAFASSFLARRARERRGVKGEVDRLQRALAHLGGDAAALLALLIRAAVRVGGALGLVHAAVLLAGLIITAVAVAGALGRAAVLLALVAGVALAGAGAVVRDALAGPGVALHARVARSRRRPCTADRSPARTSSAPRPGPDRWPCSRRRHGTSDSPGGTRWPPSAPRADRPATIHSIASAYALSWCYKAPEPRSWLTASALRPFVTRGAAATVESDPGTRLHERQPIRRIQRASSATPGARQANSGPGRSRRRPAPGPRQRDRPPGSRARPPTAPRGWGRSTPCPRSATSARQSCPHELSSNGVRRSWRVQIGARRRNAANSDRRRRRGSPRAPLPPPARWPPPSDLNSPPHSANTRRGAAAPPAAPTPSPPPASSSISTTTHSSPGSGGAGAPGPRRAQLRRLELDDPPGRVGRRLVRKPPARELGLPQRVEHPHQDPPGDLLVEDQVRPLQRLLGGQERASSRLSSARSRFNAS